MAVALIRTTQLINPTGKCTYLILEDSLNQKARNAARWRQCASSGKISDSDGQYRYYIDSLGTWQSVDDEWHVDKVYLDFE